MRFGEELRDEPTASKPGQPFQATPRAARRPQLRREWRKTGGCGSRVREHSPMVDWAVEGTRDAIASQAVSVADGQRRASHGVPRWKMKE